MTLRVRSVRQRTAQVSVWLLGLLCAPPAAWAADDPAPRATGEQELPSAPLEALPVPPSLRLPEPSAEDSQLLDGVLEKLTSLSDPNPELSANALLEVDATLLPAIRARLDVEAERSQRANLKQLLLDTRKVYKANTKRAGATDADDAPDYLVMMLSHPAPDNPAWKQLVRLLALSRMCTRIGNIEAVRVLVHVYVRFEFLRIDTQLQMNVLGDKAIAGLIEATRHQAPSVSEWARRRLDFLGKAIPSEVVQVQDAQVIADVLRAYGRVRDPDAPRLIISFANSERTQVREAARQAVALMGEVANWPLRDAYEDMVGKKAPREWTWDRTARELFKNFDQIRWAELYEHYRRGLDAQGEGKLDEMRDAFDKVLARKPDFEPKDKIVEGYFAFARDRFDKDPETAAKVLQRLMRIAPSETERARAQSLALTLRAKALSDKQVADQFPLQRARQLDPSNEQAQSLLAELSREPLTETTGFMRVLWPLLFGATAVLAALMVVLKRRPVAALPAPGASIKPTKAPPPAASMPPAPPFAADLDDVATPHADITSSSTAPAVESKPADAAAKPAPPSNDDTTPRS